jgi:tetratricopeptide (TPR) repeat protein
MAAWLAAVSPRAIVPLAVLGACVLAAWFLFGPRARRRRDYVRGHRLLALGQWQAALEIAQRRQQRRLPVLWQGRWRNLEGECHRAAAERALSEQRFEQALDHFGNASNCLGLNEEEGRKCVLESMLAEVRSLISLGGEAETPAARALTERVLALAPGSIEALFWSALCQVRQDQIQPALSTLRAAHDRGQQRYVDPPLYLGALLRQHSAAGEAVRLLAEANRLAPASPMVSGQLGMALVAAGGDSRLAVRALERSLERLTAPGLSMQRAWLDGLPDNASFIHRLVARQAFACPVLGNNLAGLVRQERQALAEAFCRIGNYSEAVRCYAAITAEIPPTAALLSGLGRALARAERYEEAYPHLRSAYEMDKNPHAAGYLALAGARAKPSRPEDRARNISWAVELVAALDARAYAELAELIALVHVEAHSVGVPISPEQQLRLCEALASVQAASPAAATAYDRLADNFPHLLQPPLAEARLAAHDRAAMHHYRQGNLEQALASLIRAQEAAPQDPLPLVRRAIVECRLGRREEGLQTLSAALKRTEGRRRAVVAFLGARLALQGFGQAYGGEPAPSPPIPLPRRRSEGRVGQFEQAIGFLSKCLEEDPDHPGALWCLAAVRSLSEDHQRLKELALRLQRSEIPDAGFHFLAACAALETGDTGQVREACRRLREIRPALAAECSYLIGCSHEQAGEAGAAATLFAEAAQASDCRARDQARVRLGRGEFAAGRFAEAVRWWQDIPPANRNALKIDAALRQTILLLSLQDYEAEQFNRAANRLRPLLQSGGGNPACRSLLVAALVKEGQRLVRRAEQENGAEQNQALANAADKLDEAVQVGGPDASVLLWLARAYQLQGKPHEARSSLRRIADPDATVLTRLADISLAEGRLEQAEQELAAAWAQAPVSYATGYNLLRTRLNLGRVKEALLILPGVMELSPTEAEGRCWQHLRALLEPCSGAANGVPAPTLTQISAEDEEQVLRFLRTIGHLETSCSLLGDLRQAHPKSEAVRNACSEAALLQGKRLLDQCDWRGARRRLETLQREDLAPPARAALLSLLGSCACLEQDWTAGIGYFQEAEQLEAADPRPVQNLALALEWQGQDGQAEKHWQRFLALVDHSAPGSPAGRPEYGQRLAAEALQRLINYHADKERWPAALAYAKEALRLHPQNAEIRERLFQLYQQAGQPAEARRTLHQLRQQRGRYPLLDLYELELLDLAATDGMEKLVADLDRLLRQNPGVREIESRAQGLLDKLQRRLEKVYGQLGDQVARVLHQVRHLPRHQIDWSAVHDVLRDLRGELVRLRRVAVKAVQIERDDEQRSALRGLIGRMERKIDQCRSMGG